MRKKLFNPLFLIFGLVVLSACAGKKSDPKPEPQLIFKFKFDPTQERLGNHQRVKTIHQIEFLSKYISLSLFISQVSKDFFI